MGGNRSGRVENLSLIHTSNLRAGLDRLALFCYHMSMMTVKQLIEKLQEQDPEDAVYAEDLFGNSYKIEDVTRNLYDDVVVQMGKEGTG